MLYDQHESVFNYGAGLEIVTGKAWSAYLSYAMDRSYVPSDISRFTDLGEEAANSSFRADFKHAGMGIILKLKKVDITLGATHARAREFVTRPIDFPDEGEDDEGIFDSNDLAEIRWSRWRFIFSFSFPFLKDIEKKMKGGDQ